MMLTRRALLEIAAAASLPDQSIGTAMNRAFADPKVSYLLTGCVHNREICSRWNHPMDPARVGSLLKPFTALAYGASHAFRFPTFFCEGTASNCWLPQGHGRMGIVSGLANSCNAYFLELASHVPEQDLAEAAEKFGLSAPPPDADAGALIGLGSAWQVSPFAITRAYSELIARSAEPGVNQILAGMALSGQSGTGRGVGRGAYVKTGTAANDGYVIALFPAEAPKFNLLVRVHGATGAQAAWVCGKMRAYVRT
ncbi:MAG TPA: penicillin-binding transpeptidase domain-containing protein [Bryobacteraceae bacterium]|nr:penicillin-binding transpeptidase domain-containing protein [Bryobacteraceae bacterium]